MMQNDLCSVCSEKLEKADDTLSKLDCTLGLAMESRSIGLEVSGLLALASDIIQDVRALLDEASASLMYEAARMQQEEKAV